MRPAEGGPNIPGLLQVGNINLLNRPIVRNKDGSISTVRSFSRGNELGEVLVPQVVGGKLRTPDWAWQHYLRTGQHLGIFDTWQHADAYAEQLHRDQEAMYARHPLTRALVKTGGVR